MTKYYVDSDGNYLGGFDGLQPPDKPLHDYVQAVVQTEKGTVPLFEKKLKIVEGKVEVDKQNRPIMIDDETKPVMITEVVGWERQPYVMPAIPDGAIEVPGPPEHGCDKWINGAWVPDLAARKALVPVTIDTVIAALAVKGIAISQADLDAVK